MPTGRYVVIDDGTAVGEEEFRCAPGPMGWRYFSEIRTNLPHPHDEVIDLVADAGWRPVRVRIQTGTHSLSLDAGGGRLTGLRDGEPIEVPWGPDVEIDYLSPAFNAVTANRLQRTAEFDVAYVEPVTCEVNMSRQRYELIGREEILTPVGRFGATRWQFTADPPDGFTAPLWVAGDVVVAFGDLFELAAYEPGTSGPIPHPAP